MKADLTRDSFDPDKTYSLVLMQQGRVQLDADWNEQGALLLRQLRTTAADIIGAAGGPADPGFALAPLELKSAAPPNADLLISSGRYYVDGILCELDATTVPVIVSDDRKTVTVPYWSPDGQSFAVGQYLRITDLNGGSLGDPGVITQVSQAQYASLALTVSPPLPAKASKNAVETLVLQRQFTYLTQPFAGGPLPALPTEGSRLAYLDVWEAAVTYVEDPAIREVALGGPDTAARLRTIAQVRLLEAETCLTPAEIAARVAPASRGLLRAQTPPPTQETDPCTIAPDSGYRGPENQLYRVEIHTGGGDGDSPSFKWSRENASVLFEAVSVTSGDGATTVVLSSLGRDDRFGLAIGDYVELESDLTVLAPPSPPNPLLQVSAIDAQSLTVTLTGAADPKAFVPALRPRLRRWDHTGAVGADNAIPIPSDGVTWVDLEDGVQVQFAVAGATFVSGDYWQIPARVVTGQVIWPADTWLDAKGAVQTAPALCPPKGVIHHYAPLAVIDFNAKGPPSVQTSCQLPRHVT